MILMNFPILWTCFRHLLLPQLDMLFSRVIVTLTSLLFSMCYWHKFLSPQSIPKNHLQIRWGLRVKWMSVRNRKMLIKNKKMRKLNVNRVKMKNSNKRWMLLKDFKKFMISCSSQNWTCMMLRIHLHKLERFWGKVSETRTKRKVNPTS